MGPRPATMFTLQTGFAAVNYSTRGALPQMIQAITVEAALTTEQKGVLLSAFFPIYCMLMIPAGYLVKNCGAKLSVTLDLCTHAVALLLFPTLGRVFGVPGMVVCLSLLGAAQTPIFPVLNTLRRDWLPKDASRAWVLQMMRVGGSTSSVLIKMLVPRMMRRWGWTAVPYAFGGVSAAFAIVWHSLAADKPEAVQSPAANGSSPLAEEKGKALEPFSWRLFRVPAVLACMLSHVADNNTKYAVSQWAPTMYAALGATPVETGTFLAVPGVCGFCVSWLVAAVEMRLTQKGVPDKTTRRYVSFVANTWQGLATIGFAVARSPLQMCIANCCIMFSLQFQNLSVSLHLFVCATVISEMQL